MCKKENIKTYRKKAAFGISATEVGITVDTEEEVESENRDGIDYTRGYEVPAARYRIVTMPTDGNWVHRQIVCGVFLAEGSVQEDRSQFFLFKEALNKNKIFAVLPKALERWSSNGGENTTKKLAYNASPEKVREFLLKN